MKQAIEQQTVRLEAQYARIEAALARAVAKSKADMARMRFHFLCLIAAVITIGAFAFIALRMTH